MIGSQKFAKFLLWLNAGVWLGFGLGYTFMPGLLASLVGATIPAEDSLRVMTDVGVMMVGIAGWYIVSVLDDARIDSGLISAMLIGGGLLIGRLVGIVAVGSANGIVWTYLALEALDTVLLVFAVRARAVVRRSAILAQ